MRIVLDTNVLIAAALKGGLSEQILRLSTSRDLTLIVSEEIIKELTEKLLTKFAWKEDEASLYIRTVRESAEIVTPSTKVDLVKDPDDNKILEAALEGKAELIVSIDQDLIKLKSFSGIGIVHPKTLTWILPKLFEKARY